MQRSYEVSNTFAISEAEATDGEHEDWKRDGERVPSTAPGEGKKRGGGGGGGENKTIYLFGSRHIWKGLRACLPFGSQSYDLAFGLDLLQ